MRKILLTLFSICGLAVSAFADYRYAIYTDERQVGIWGNHEWLHTMVITDTEHGTYYAEAPIYWNAFLNAYKHYGEINGPNAYRGGEMSEIPPPKHVLTDEELSSWASGDPYLPEWWGREMLTILYHRIENNPNLAYWEK